MNDILSKVLDSPVQTYGISLTVLIVSYIAIKGLFSKDSGSRSYPPGPPRHPLIGAAASFPQDRFPEKFCEWATTYGDIVYAPLPGMDMFILNSADIAEELLSKRGSSTGARRPGYLVYDLMGWGWNLAFLQPSNPHFTTQRKMLRRSVGPQVVNNHEGRVETTVAKFMTELRTFQGDLVEKARDFIDELSTKMSYGEQISSEMWKDISIWNKDAVSILTEAAFDVFPVNAIKSLRYIPDWVPGLRFKQMIKQGNDLSDKIRFTPYKRGLELYKSGKLEHCILSDLLDGFGEGEDVQDALAVLWSGTVETITSEVIQILHSLFFFPEVQEKVFKEIQSVTQGRRLPKFEDRSKMPYTVAVFKEAVRWRPIFPIGIPHVNDQDQVVRGYFIPKGAFLHQNNRMMCTDPKVWGDPEVFRPERFLDANASKLPDPLMIFFGWGLRLCPGMLLGERVVFQMVATIVSLYKIVPLEGQEIPDHNKVEYTTTPVQQPIGFNCRFALRDGKAQSLYASI